MHTNMMLNVDSSPLLCICVIAFGFVSKLADAACTSGKFECDNGSCISPYEVCDGVKNCPDGSDETGLKCVSQRKHCTKPYFQCSYGACVIGTAPCNGVSECADGSDETVLRCGTDDDVREFDRRQQGNCRSDEIKCPSGICIDKSLNVCNGKDDCLDGSGFDESVTLCGHLECPGYSFKCASGSCISSDLMCNGKIDCFDQSDEAPLLCNTTNLPETRPPVLTLPETRECRLPQGDERPILKNRLGVVQEPPITKGTVYFSCNTGYALVGGESGHCANSYWSLPSVPKCVKYCDSRKDSSGKFVESFNGYSTKATCIYEDNQVNCNQRYHPPGTKITFLCATGFRTIQTALPDIVCLPNGQWSRDRLRCEQDCGQIATPIKQFSAFGYSINNEVIPWHVGLYLQQNERDYIFMCGGSLLTPDVVITAAHCVFNRGANTTYKVELFKVVASKLYRNYNDVTNEDRRQDVHSITVAQGYKGAADNFYKDLALIILKVPYELSNVIRPVCIHFSDFSEKETVNDNVSGKFAGWNYKDKRELQFVPAISKTNSECQGSLRDIRPDKFCMFTQGQSLACQGDSGGGFTTERMTLLFSRDNVRHFLYGVISSAPAAGDCAHSLTTLTNIQYFEDIITQTMLESYHKRA